jgi:hypothetical protein
MYIAPMNLVGGMAGELFANVREDFQISRPTDERMPQAVIAERAKLPPLTSFCRPMRHSNSRFIHQSAKHIREAAVTSARFAVKSTKNRRLRIVADRKRFEIINQVGMQKDYCLPCLRPAVFCGRKLSTSDGVTVAIGAERRFSGKNSTNPSRMGS